MIRLGILLSGRGSNFQAIQEAIEAGQLTGAEIAVVLSNKSAAPGLEVARSKNIPAQFISRKAHSTSEAYDQALVTQLRTHQVDVVVLAGYMRILTPDFIQAYAGRILNIHPSLLPAYGGEGMYGEKVHTAVLAGAESQSGCTVHLVTEEVDAGPILGQSEVPVLPEDTPMTLAARILEQEHRLYPQVIQSFIQTLQKEPSHAT